MKKKKLGRAGSHSFFFSRSLSLLLMLNSNTTILLTHSLTLVDPTLSKGIKQQGSEEVMIIMISKLAS